MFSFKYIFLEVRSVEEVYTVFTRQKRLQTEEESSVQNTLKSTNTNDHSPPALLSQNKTCIREGQSSQKYLQNTP